MFYRLFKALLFRVDAERAHDLTSGLLQVSGKLPLARRMLEALYAYDDPILAVSCAGLPMANPLGLAAGFDKRGALIGPLGALGFGHLEVGTVTPRAQPGNERPRLFRLPEDRALINRLGFNSPGMLAVAQNLRDAQRAAKRFGMSTLVGVNIGKNRATPLEQAVEDYIATFVALARLADYVTVNISSPNTPGLRRLHERVALEGLLGALMELNRRLAAPRPIFLKVSPDETPAQLDQVVQAACAAGVSGFIATNTTIERADLQSPRRVETGGLSGRPLVARSRAVIAQLHQATGGRLPVIGVGGIADADDAYHHICAGATLVQLYTGLIYEGPGVVRAIKRGLAERLRRDGYGSLNEAVGRDISVYTPTLHKADSCR